MVAVANCGKPLHVVSLSRRSPLRPADEGEVIQYFSSEMMQPASRRDVKRFRFCRHDPKTCPECLEITRWWNMVQELKFFVEHHRYMDQSVRQFRYWSSRGVIESEKFSAMQETAADRDAVYNAEPDADDAPGVIPFSECVARIAAVDPGDYIARIVRMTGQWDDPRALGEMTRDELWGLLCEVECDLSAAGIDC